MFIIDKNTIDNLITILSDEGYKTIGPTVRENAIIYDEIRTTNDLPVGWTDEQDDAFYRIKKRNDKALFGYNVGPYSWKKFLFPPRKKLMEFKKDGKKFDVVENEPDNTKYAFLGVRSCELNAIFVQDKVFQKGEFVDSNYDNLRDKVFIIAVNCVQAGGTCFCVSMKTGPKAKEGFDLVITEILNEKEHKFLIDSGSSKGNGVLDKLSRRDATQDERNRSRIKN